MQTGASEPIALPHLPRELDYVVLLFALFVVPRILQRWRIPTGVTNLALGVVAGLGLGLFIQDTTIRLLATLGIVSLFLFAGLEVSLHELRTQAATLIQHIVIGVGALAAVSGVIYYTLGLPWRPSILVALALLTPSTGFILDSLPSSRLTSSQQFWTKSKAVASELVALGVLFLTLRSTSATGLASSTLILAALIALLPYVFRVFALRVVPFAPKSEFAFLLMVAIVCAFVTRRLGVYYLVGAFLVGIVAQRFRERQPAIASEQMLHAVEVFASFFIPFYFFNAGLHIGSADFGPGPLLLGIIFLATAVPLRLALVAGHRVLLLREPLREGVRIGLAMLPTLVFTLVIAEILRARFAVPNAIFGGLILYTLVNTVLPGVLLQRFRAEPAGTLEPTSVPPPGTAGMMPNSVDSASLRDATR
jgi:Kef-type K+ transport system membrane component KefB